MQTARTGAGQPRARHAEGPAPETPLRVLWLIKGLGSGGAERLLCLLAEERDREAFHYEAAYLLSHKSALAEELARHGVPVRCLDAGRAYDLRWARRLVALLRERPADILHVHSPYVAGVARLAVRSLPRRLRPRLISTEHVPWSGYALPTRVLNAITFGMDHAHITVSGAVRDSIPRILRGDTEVVVHGIAVERVREVLAERETTRRELGAGPGDVLVGTIANFREQKDYPNLLAAAGIVLARGAPVRFVAVGQGPLEGEIRRLHGELGLGERFALLGFRPDADRILAACDVFGLGSRYEGLPLAVMEALALGLPVVATAVGGVPEVVAHGVEGLLVPPARPDLLAEAIEMLVRDPERRARMGEAAAVRGGTLDVSRAARRIERLYRRVAGRTADGIEENP